MTTTAWPWPADTKLDIARRLLQSYRAALSKADPDGCALIDAKAAAVGQGWVVPKIETVDLDDLLTAVEAAELVGVTAQVIYQWAYRGHIPRHTSTSGSASMYRAGDVLDHLTRTRRQRGENRGAGQCRI